MNTTVLFDFDGTLVDSREIMLTVYNNIAKKHNYKKVDANDFAKLSTLSIKEKCNLLNVPIHSIPFLVYKAKKDCKKYVSELKFINGILDVLNNLKSNNFNLSIISSNSKSLIESFLKKNKAHVFDTILTSGNVFGKHHIIKKFLRTHGLKPSQVLYVGDETRDIVACKKSNIKMIAVSWGFDSIELLKKESPEYTVSKPFEMLDIIKTFEGDML